MATYSEHEQRELDQASGLELDRNAARNLEAEMKDNARLRESLSHALAQWKMYAEMSEDRDLETEQTAEAELWREIKEECGA